MAEALDEFDAQCIEFAGLPVALGTEGRKGRGIGFHQQQTTRTPGAVRRRGERAASGRRAA